MKTYPFLAILIITFLGSCVSQKKFDALAQDKSRLMRENLRLQDVEKSYHALQAEKQTLETALAGMEKELSQLRNEYTAMKNECDELRRSYNQLEMQNSSLLESSSQEKRNLTEELARKQEALDVREKDLARMERTISEKEMTLNSLQDELSAREARIAELSNQLNSQKQSMEMLKARIKEALLGFSDADLTVTHKDGKIYVSLSQNLLFAKNSKVIDAKGKEALQKLARVLNQNPDLAISVEGHTDTDGSAEYNWDLSVDRAIAVVKILTDEGVKGERVTATGRAFFAPVAPNDTEPNKSKNRRTDIVLSPKLDAIYEMLSSEE